MTIIESIQYYLPELMQAMEETLIMMSISIFAAVLIGLPLGILLFISREKQQSGNDFVSNIKFADHGHSFVSLFTVCCCDDSRHSFFVRQLVWADPSKYPIEYCVNRHLCSFSRAGIVGCPRRCRTIGTLIRCLHLSICQRIFARGSKKRVNPVSDDNDRQYGVLFHSDGNRWRRRESETLPSVMDINGTNMGSCIFFSILVMIVAVFSIQLIGNGLAKKVDKRK